MLALTVLGIGLALVGIGVAVSGLLSALLIAAGIVVALLALPVWLKGKARPLPPEPPLRTGYLGREGSKGNLRYAKFGKDLDIAIDNAGDVDAEEAEFAE